MTDDAAEAAGASEATDGPEAAAASPLDVAVVIAAPWLLGGLLAAIPLLLVPDDGLRNVFLLQLSALTVLAVLVSGSVAPLINGTWYPTYRLSPFARRLAGGVSLVVIVTGVIGLVTLATSAALRYQPSVQFLQLLSALDIAWVVAATLVGAHRLWGRTAAIAAGALIGAFCVASIANYLRVVGFSDDGQWIVDGENLLRLVIPFDMLAALVAIGVLIAAARKESAD